MLSYEEINAELMRKLDNRDDLVKEKTLVETLWTLFPEVCKQVQIDNTREEQNWTPDMGVVVDMIKKDNYLRPSVEKLVPAEEVDALIEKINSVIAEIEEEYAKKK